MAQFLRLQLLKKGGGKTRFYYFQKNFLKSIDIASNIIIIEDVRLMQEDKNMKTYDAKKIAEAISRNGLKETKEYEQMESNIFDWTSSCDIEEATRCLMFYMKEAIAKGTGKYNLELRCQFLAAYEFYTSLVGHNNFEITVWF